VLKREIIHTARRLDRAGGEQLFEPLPACSGAGNLISAAQTK